MKNDRTLKIDMFYIAVNKLCEKKKVSKKAITREF